MGRYAYFNTGFEYKFLYAVQESTDIHLFKGCVSKEECVHIWDDSERRAIRKIILTFPFPEPVWSDYEKTVDGTRELLSELMETVPTQDLEYLARYTLGCVIYHQLLYTPVLKAKYQL